MPRVRQTDNQQKDDLVRGYLAKAQAILRMSDEQVANKLHCDRSTYQRKKKRPATFTLGELRRLCEALKITDEEFAYFK